MHKKKKFQLKIKLPLKIRWKQTFFNIKTFFFAKFKQFKKLSLKKKIICFLIGLLVLFLLVLVIRSVVHVRRSGRANNQPIQETKTGAEEVLEIERELQPADYDYRGWRTWETKGYRIQCPPVWFCGQVMSPTEPVGPVMENLAIFIYQDHQPSWDYFEEQKQIETNKKAKVKIGEYELEKVEFAVMDKQHDDYRLEVDGKKFTINVVTPKGQDQSQYLDLIPQILASFKVL
jgi:hypothetical protein